MPVLDEWVDKIHTGDAGETLRQMPESSVHMAMCSPPYYGLRDYGVDGQIGLEDSLEAYIQSIVEVGEELKRVLLRDGNWWLNLGDSFSGAGPNNHHNSDTVGGAPEGVGARRDDGAFGRKNKMLIPHRIAIALQDAGWVVRGDYVWAKQNPMPQPVKDRLNETKEFVFHLTPHPDYYFDLDAIRGPKGSNPGDIFEVVNKPVADAHFATYPNELCKIPIRSTCPPGGIVLDPFAGSGTTCLTAKELGRRFIGIELNPEYADVARSRLGLELDDPANVRDDPEQVGVDAF